MIEISHQQAQRMIRKNLDDRIPEEQWAQLQAHLENCQRCRGYEERLSGVEKRLRRSLLSLWSGVYDETGDQTAQAVLLARRERAARRHKILLAAAAGAAVLLIFLVIRQARYNAMIASIPQTGGPVVEVTPTHELTALPTPDLRDFRGIVAFESSREGNGEIYLLNPGSGEVPGDLINLTSHPAEDTSPSWSPDGEWVAFLSDRTGRRELFVTNVAGSRLVQLTDEPHIRWEGELSWSGDGKYIALTGIRESQGGQSWVYLIPLDGSGPRSLPKTRGGESPEFAPLGERLAYSYSDGERSGVAVYSISTSEKVEANWIHQGPADLEAPASFDWSHDGTGLAYLASRPPLSSSSGNAGEVAGSSAAENPARGSQIIAARDLNYSISLFYDYQYNVQVARSGWSGAFRGVTWSPGSGIVYLENQDESFMNDDPFIRQSGCWKLQFQQIGRRGRRSGPFAINNLCVTGAVDRASWTPDGRWLVVIGYEANQADDVANYSLFAVRMPGRPTRYNSSTSSSEYSSPIGTVLRLSNPETDRYFERARLPRVRPRLSAFASQVNINPQPAWPQQLHIPDSNAAEAPGQVVFVRNLLNYSEIITANPDGSSERRLTGSEARYNCPRWSPDGSRIAYISDQSGHHDLNLYVVDADGSNPVQLTQGEWVHSSRPDASGFIDYGCPAWSPDGKQLAVIIRTAGYTNSGQSLLATMPVVDGDGESGAQARFAPLSHPISTGGPVWSREPENGNYRIFIADMPGGSLNTTILSIRVPENFEEDLVSHSLEWLEREEGLMAGMSMSPQGDMIGIVTLTLSGRRDTSYAVAFFRRLDMEQNPVRQSIVLGTDNPRNSIRSGTLTWLTGDGLGIILRNPPDERYKAFLQRFDLPRQSLDTLTSVEDVLYDVAWSPDGKWVTYITESGRWLLDVDKARENRAAPVWLSDEPVQDIDWR